MKIVILMKCLIVLFGIVLFVSLIEGVDFKIKEISPDQDVVSFFKGESQTLSISGEDYDNIKWYLNGEFVKNDNNVFELDELDSKIYIVRVDVVNGDEVDSKTWNVVVKEKQIIKETGLDKFEVIYYVYISVLLIVIFLIAYLFILEKKKRPKTHRS